MQNFRSTGQTLLGEKKPKGKEKRERKTLFKVDNMIRCNAQGQRTLGPKSEP
jgi:hypothetical protein